jgi:ubiquinone/menaquinone biosynthesis C-methylase UbiE
MFKVGTTNEAFRHGWIEKALKDLPAGYRLLDAGAGECPYRKHCGHLDYVAQDFAQYTGDGSTGLQTGTWDNSKLDIVSDITSIPVTDASFDAVMCTEVLEHVPDPIAALRELARVLRPGGTMILTSPFASLTHFAPYHFCSGFNRYFYEHHLPLLGLEITELTMNGNYFEYIAQELRRVKHVAARYTPRKVNILEKALVHGVLYTLQRLSGADHGSSELLAYGIHIIARKS